MRFNRGVQVVKSRSHGKVHVRSRSRKSDQSTFKVLVITVASIAIQTMQLQQPLPQPPPPCSIVVDSDSRRQGHGSEALRLAYAAIIPPQRKELQQQSIMVICAYIYTHSCSVTCTYFYM